MKMKLVILLVLISLFCITNVETRSHKKTLKKSLKDNKKSRKATPLNEFLADSNFGGDSGKKASFKIMAEKACKTAKQHCTIFRHLYFPERWDSFLLECLTSWAGSKDGNKFEDFKDLTKEIKQEIEQVINKKGTILIC